MSRLMEMWQVIGPDWFNEKHVTVISNLPRSSDLVLDLSFQGTIDEQGEGVWALVVLILYLVKEQVCKYKSYVFLTHQTKLVLICNSLQICFITQGISLCPRRSGHMPRYVPF